MLPIVQNFIISVFERGDEDFNVERLHLLQYGMAVMMERNKCFTTPVAGSVMFYPSLYINHSKRALNPYFNNTL